MPPGNRRCIAGAAAKQQAIDGAIDADAVGEGLRWQCGVRLRRAGEPLARLVRQLEAGGDRFGSRWVARQESGEAP